MEKNQNIEKIKALFLNKVEGLNWYYFDIDFNTHFPEKAQIKSIEHDDFVNFLSQINIDNITGKYKYSGTPQSDTKTVLSLLMAYIKKYPEIIGAVIKRIFDIKENEVLNKSEAMDGLMGKFNESDREHRNKIYNDRIKNFTRDKDHFVILAEGDSWFEFPKLFLGARFLGKDIVKDILDWVIEDENYAVYSLAAGGDWLSNMMYMGEYITELPRVSPDVFLISGGGNDMVGDHRLATMVVNPVLNGKRDLTYKHIKRLIDLRCSNSPIDFDTEKYKLGISLIADDFYNFLNICMAQYFLFIYNLNSSNEYKNMIFITQGYDYAIPSDKRHNFFLSSQHLENMIINSGKWLYDALQMKGVTDPEEQRAVLYACIYEFNEMLISLATYDNFRNVFHIDNRNVADSEEAWMDELHLKSEYFERIANTYKKCIKDNARKNNWNIAPVKKVYKT